MEKEITTESKVVTFIGGFYVFGGVVVLLSLIFGGSSLNTAFSLPNIPDALVKSLVALIFIPMGILYTRRRKAAYWFVLMFSIVFFCISADLVARQNGQPYIGNMIYALFVAVVTIVKRKEFQIRKKNDEVK